MQELMKIKALAFEYFDGTISSENETVLYSFLKKNKENGTFLRVWEDEWAKSLSEKELINNPDWDAVKQKNTHVQLTPQKEIGKIIVFWKTVSAVAVVSFLLLGVGFLVNYIKSNAAGQHVTTVQAPKGEKSKVVLYDGSVVWLNSDSKLTYLSAENKSKFTVKLEGEAYFEIAKNNKRTFVVETPSYHIQVKGTKFNVSAYAEDHFITTTLVEGAIDILYQDKILAVVPNETVQFNTKTGEFLSSFRSTSDVDAWTKNCILYENIALSELVVKLSRQYGVIIAINDPLMAAKPLTISLRNDETIDDVMQAIKKVLPIEVKRNGKKYIITEKITKNS